MRTVWESGITARRNGRRVLAAVVALVSIVGATLCISTSPTWAATVTKLDDDGSVGTLRWAVGQPGTTTFAPDLSGTIELNEEIDLVGLQTVQGPGADKITISGKNQARIFNINANGFDGTPGVEISGLTLTAGRVSGPGNVAGGAILKTGNLPLIITDSHISHSVAHSTGGGWARGGAIAVEQGDVVMTNVTLSQNQSQGTGGLGAEGGGGGLAVYDLGGSATLTNVTVSGNTASPGTGVTSHGGGVWLQTPGSHQLRNTTVSGNHAVFGGGLYAGSEVRMLNSILGNNTVISGGQDCLVAAISGAQVTLAGENVVEDPSSCTLAGTTPIVDDPKLGDLLDNGGPTPTHALLPGSPAIDKAPGGFSEDDCPGSSGPNVDQRGAQRPQGSACDLGAYEAVDPKVTTSDDSGPGSLRYAIEYAASGGTVTFDDAVTEPVELTSGEIEIDRPLTIDGPGAQELAVSGNDESRVFNVTAGGDVEISGLTLTEGRHQVAGHAAGGAVYKDGDGTLTLTDSRITNSTASSTSATSRGGGIHVDDGGLVVENSTLSGNSASGSGAFGGGISTGAETNADVSLMNATVSNNVVSATGASPSRGGGLYITFDAHARLMNTTVTMNSAQGDSGIMRGGGLFTVDDVELVNSLIGGNTASSGSECAADEGGTIAGEGVNLIETNCGVGGTVIEEDPQLGPLALNQGQTETHALLPGSPAIDAAPVAPSGDVCPPPSTDQRGVTRPQGATCDLGAYEVEVPVAMVTNTNNIGPGSLRQAVGDVPDGGAVVFDEDVFGGDEPKTITLSGQISINKELTITGPGADKLTVSGNLQSQVFVMSGTGDVTITGLEVTRGRAAFQGGAIERTGGGDLTLRKVQVTDSSAGGLGGGIHVFLGDLTIEDSTISGNVAGSGASGDGGGLNAGGGGRVTMRNVTISGNAANNGGGMRITAAGPSLIENVTITGNTAVTSGGGARLDPPPAGSITVADSIVAGNNAPTQPDCRTDDDLSEARGVNLIQDPAGCSLSGGQKIEGVDPLLGPLQDNGGTTETHALLPGSPAVDAATDPEGDSACPPPATDQRGLSRAQGDACDLGAYELALRTVTNDGDMGVGSLRWAIDEVPRWGVVDFDLGPGQHEILLITAALNIEKGLTISGPGAQSVAVSGNGTKRVFEVDSDDDVRISGLTLTNGRHHADDGGGRGGAVFKGGTGKLTMTDSQVSNSVATSDGDTSIGGGIFVDAGALALEGVTLADNTASSGALAFGGGLGTSGSLGNPGDVRVSMANVTVSGNQAKFGAGLALLGESAVLKHTTVASNTASINVGGIGAFGSVELVNSVVADNVGGDCDGPITGKGVNLIATNCGVGGEVVAGDPRLGDLQLNGGETATHALLSGSPAIDAATNPNNDDGAGCPPPDTDQQGVSRPQGQACDLGAYEVKGAIVTNKENSGTGSLRQAVLDVEPGGTITFSSGVTGTLAVVGEIDIAKPLKIRGPGAQMLELSGGSANRIFDITGNGDVDISALSLKSGLGAGSGGAINKTSTEGTLKLTETRVMSSSATQGGGIASQGDVLLENVTVGHNEAENAGGGLRLSGGGTLRNVTVSGNETFGVGTSGGGLFLSGSKEYVLEHVTIADNRAATGGGLADVASGDVRLVNSIIGENTGTVSNPDCDGALVGEGRNLIEDPETCSVSGLSESLITAAPALGELHLNGGQTETHALLNDSPAINAAPDSGDENGGCPPPNTDQRGVTRPQGPSCDLGAFEARPTVTVTKEVVSLANPDLGKFDLLVDGVIEADDVGDGGTTGAVEADAGGVEIGEAAGSGTSLDAYDPRIECSNGQQADDTTLVVEFGSVTIAVECTITNTRRRGTLKVVKDLKPLGDPGKFDLLIDDEVHATSVGDGGETEAVEVTPGVHTVSEDAAEGTLLADYDSEVSCNDDDAQSGEGPSLAVTVEADEDVVCTITNKGKAGTLQVVKNLEPDSDPGKFDLLIDGVRHKEGVGDGGQTEPVEVTAGEHTVSEDGASGTLLSSYDSEISCLNEDNDEQKGSGSSLQVTVEEGASVVCTITNTRQTGTLHVVKQLRPVNDAGRFNLLIDDVVRKQAAGHLDHTEVVTVLPGEHTVSEAAAPGSSLADYDSSIECDNGQQGEGSSLQVTVAAHEGVLCTITNTRKTGTLRVVKNLEPDGDPGKFDLRIDGVAHAQAVGDRGDTAAVAVPIGTHIVSEVAAGTTTLGDYDSSIACDNGQSGEGSSLAVTVEADAAVVCTITNTRKQSPSPPPPGPGPQPPPPGPGTPQPGPGGDQQAGPRGETPGPRGSQTPPVSSPPARSGSPLVTVVTGTVKVDRRGRASVWVACPRTEASCRGTVTLSVQQRVRAAGRRRARVRVRTVTLGRAQFRLRRGQRRAVRVRLNRQGRRSMRGRRSLRARITVRAVDSAGNPRVTRRSVRLTRARR